MKTIIATLQLAIIFILCSCAHVYKAPDKTQVVAKTKIVEADQKKAHALNAEIKIAFKTAKEHADAVIIKSTEIEGKLEEIIKVAPPELQLALAEVKSDVQAQRLHEDALVQILGTGYDKEEELETHLTLTDTHIAELKAEQVILFAGGEQLAQQATKESAAKATAQRKNWSFTIISASLVVGGILLFIFWKVVVTYLKSKWPL